MFRGLHLPLIVLAAAGFSGAALAQNAPFSLGDRVTVGSTGESGIVIEIGAAQVTGGTFIKVHLDRFGIGTPTGIWYDSVLSRLSPDAGGTARPPSAVSPARRLPALAGPQDT